MLARLLQHGSRANPHRPVNDELRFAATLAQCTYEEWRSRNKKRGINAHGHANDMKSTSATFVVENLFSGADRMVTAVCELMDRPKNDAPTLEAR